MPHYYSAEQTSSIKLKKIDIETKDDSFQLYSGSGVFSKEKLDTGTKLLIENAVIKDSWRILDLGCGTGALGIALLRRFRGVAVVFTDVNKRAVMLAQKNIELHCFGKRAQAIESDVFENIKGKFDAILLNPPQTAGKELCFRMIEEAAIHLRKNGLLEIVARHKKGGKTLSEKMMEVFGNMRTAAMGAGFRVYVSEQK
ncbi:MAG: methyltransferase [Candidatus Woesearchaeota archaeon]